MTERNEKQWCTSCGARFTAEEVVGANKCPKCGHAGVPCATERDFLVEINWHELRILGIWASNWADRFEQDDDSGRRALRGVLSRLERQAPDMPPLTLGGELRQIRALPGVNEIESDIPRETFAVVNGPGAVGHSKRPPRLPYPPGMGEESRRLHREYNALVKAQREGAKNAYEVVKLTDECAAKGIILVPGGENL